MGRKEFKRPRSPANRSEEEFVSPGPSNPLRSHLPSDYTPPHGTSVTPEAFTPVAGGWSIEARNETGSPVAYLLELVGDPTSHPAHAFLHVDGEEQTYVNPFSHVQETPVAPVHAWFDYVAKQDALGREASRNDPFEGDDIETAFKRAELNIVFYGSSPTATQNYAHPSELQSWFEEALERTTVKVEVHALTVDAPKRLRPHLGDPLVFMGWEDNEATGWTSTLFTYPVHPRFWWTAQTAGNHDLPPQTCTMRMSGSQVLSSRAFALSYEHLLAKGVVLSPGDEGLSPEGSLGAYWVAHVVGTDYALVFPKDFSHVRVDVDDDGLLVHLTVQSIEQATALGKDEDAFARRWGRWLDDETYLSPEELEVETRAAELNFELRVYADEAAIPEEGSDG